MWNSYSSTGLNVTKLAPAVLLTSACSIIRREFNQSINQSSFQKMDAIYFVSFSSVQKAVITESANFTTVSIIFAATFSSGSHPEEFLSYQPTDAPPP